ncbi:hypothetical protein [Bacillus toyonensis]|uniref:hypothetical protein n=1 Tax=Bacillus toyonensis TaxID=155322 RepID=UPI00159BE34E|nr:hypothetical protein [Bacillus toyonensis]
MRNSKKSTSKIPPHMVAWLSAEGWTAEELSFVDKYRDKLINDAVDALDANSLKKVREIKKIYDRQEAQKGERNREYDSKNKLQRIDSPSWFGEGINRDLFK